MDEHQCIDCIAEVRDDARLHSRKPRKIVVGESPSRCSTHSRAFKTWQRKQSRARQVERTYDITAEDNHELFLLQGGRCWLCRKATGATKSLAVDHDHSTNEVRGRLCGPCNQFIGKLGDDPEAARRLVAYLTGDTPYRRLKAQQLLETAFEGPVTVLQVVSSYNPDGVALLADWKPVPDNGMLSRRTMVRTPDGVWQAIP